MIATKYSPLRALGFVAHTEWRPLRVPMSSAFLARAMALAITERIPAQARHALRAGPRRAVTTSASSSKRSSPASPASGTSYTPPLHVHGFRGGGSGSHSSSHSRSVVHRRSLTVSRAIPKKAASSYDFDRLRLRASDEFVDEEEDDVDPLVHFGRPNRSAIKRVIQEYKQLTKVLCDLPKSSIAKIPMPDDVRDEVYATIAISSNIARKRSEGRVTKLLRGLDDDEVLPIQRAVENLQNGVGLLTVEPEVEMTAQRWRDIMIEGDKDAQSEIFALMSERDDWTFTRQDLSRTATSARKEQAEAEAARAAAIAAAEAAEAEATVMPDGTTVPSAKPAPTVAKKKKGGAGKSKKQLLKYLRHIAEMANDKGLL